MFCVWHWLDKIVSHVCTKTLALRAILALSFLFLHFPHYKCLLRDIKNLKWHFWSEIPSLNGFQHCVSTRDLFLLFVSYYLYSLSLYYSWFQAIIFVESWLDIWKYFAWIWQKMITYTRNFINPLNIRNAVECLNDASSEANLTPNALYVLLLV